MPDHVFFNESILHSSKEPLQKMGQEDCKDERSERTGPKRCLLDIAESLHS